MKYKLSICIPTFNRAEYLSKLLLDISSQLNATQNLTQVVVCDNASTDGTTELCLQMQRNGLNLKYIRNPVNIGPDRNFLASVAGSEGEYTTIIGDDDSIRDGYINYILENLKHYEPEVFITDRFQCDINLNPKLIQKCGSQMSEVCLYDFGRRVDRFKYFKSVDSFIGIFSFISNFGFKTSSWNSSDNYDFSIGSAYPHVYKTLDILVKQRGRLLYLPEACIFARLGNDSFLSSLNNSEFKRWQLDFKGYWDIANYFFKNDNEMHREFLNPVRHVLNENSIPHYLEMATKDASLNEAHETLKTYGLMNIYP